MSFIQDIRLSMRSFMRSPCFTLTAVLTLALGIGANTTVFSVAYGVLLRPLCYKDEDRLVRLYGANVEENRKHTTVSWKDVLSYRDQSKTFEGICAYTTSSCNLTQTSRPRRLESIHASSNTLSVLGVSPSIGQDFQAEADEFGGDGVVLLAEHVWKSQYGADPGIVGKAIVLDRKPRIVLGVLSSEFVRSFGEFDVWLPLPDELHIGSMPQGGFFAIARLKDGVEREHAQSDINAISARLATAKPDADAGWTVEVLPIRTTLVDSQTEKAILALSAAVVLVLLASCANLTYLLLARAGVRDIEFSLRSALGASRWRMTRQAIAECSILGLCGGTVGLILAVWGTHALAGFLPEQFPRRNEIGVDETALLFTMAISIASAIAVGIISSTRRYKNNLSSSLKSVSRTVSGDSPGHRRRDVLIAGQVAITLALLTCAGLTIRSFIHLQAVDPGFDPDNLLTARVEIPDHKAQDFQARPAFFRNILDEIRLTPGVTSAAASFTLPLGDRALADCIIGDGQKHGNPNDPLNINTQTITPEFFRTMNIPLIKGRDFNRQDNASSKPVAIVGESLANQLWPGSDPIGRTIRVLGRRGPRKPMTVVGVVGDVKHNSLQNEMGYTLYRPHSQHAVRMMRLVARTKGSPMEASPAIHRAVCRVDPDQALYSVRTMEDFVFEDIGDSAIYALVMGAFASLALALTATGVYGVVSCSVSQRTREIGVRMALGAQPASILRLVLGRSLILIAIGIAGGVCLSITFGRIFEAVSYEASMKDPLIVAGVAASILLSAMIASYLPARKATKIDPNVALRYS